MLYFIHGTDREKIIKKRDEVVAQLRSKRPNSNFVVLDAENFSESALDELMQGGGLFDEKHIVQLNNLFSDKKFSGSLLVRVKELEKSPSAFVAADGEVDTETLKKIEKAAYKIVAFGQKTGEKKKNDGTAVFAIADAFGARDGKRAWALYQKAIRQGASPEEIHGTLFWQVKSIALSKTAKSAGETGLLPFVFQKSSRYAKNFSEDELKEILHTLVTLYHDSRTEDSEPLETALEQFFLKV